MQAADLPLKGIKILSIEQYGAGPYGTMLLADLGADVIKIEAPSMGGDVSRATGPYFLGEQDSQFYQTFSRGKSSIALEIKTAEGRAQFEALVKEADAVANNLRGDQPAKMAITYEDLKSINPKIVCAHLSAYGRDNDRASWPGYDYLMQAEAGLMSMSGEPDGPPVRCGLSIIDFHTGSQLAVGLLAGILGAHRSGQGCDIDVALFDTALHQLSYPATWYLNEGVEVGRLPRGAHPSIAPRHARAAVLGLPSRSRLFVAPCLIQHDDCLSGHLRFTQILGLDSGGSLVVLCPGISCTWHVHVSLTTCAQRARYSIL